MSEKKPPGLFEAGHPASVAMLECWENLLQNKGDRAELRRCKNLEEVQLTSAFLRNYWKLIDVFKKEKKAPNKQQMAIIIALAAYIEDGEKAKTGNFSYQIAEQVSPDNKKPKLSELRFRRLLKINDREKLFRFLIQVIRLLDKKVNLLDLLRIAYFWGDKTKIELAYKYYEKANLEN
jgi:CRISPR system Cascade subunit CasB